VVRTGIESVEFGCSNHLQAVAGCPSGTEATSLCRLYNSNFFLLSNFY
jgi:hypothetical protein